MGRKNAGRKNKGELKGWLQGTSHGQEGGFFHPSLSLQSEHRRQHLALQTAVKAGEVLIKIPNGLLLSQNSSQLKGLLAKDESLKEDLEEVTPTEMLAMTILYESLQQSSTWSTYLRHLEGFKLDIPIFWDAASPARQLVAATSLATRLEDIDGDFLRTFVEQAKPLLVSEAVGLKEEDLKIEAFTRCCALAMAYGWAHEDGHVFIAPMAELLVSYFDGEADNIIVDSGDEFLTIIAKSDLDAKDRLCLSFGGVSSAESMWKYGCVARDTVTAVKLSAERLLAGNAMDDEDEEEVTLCGSPFDEVEIDATAVFQIVAAGKENIEEKQELLEGFGLFDGSFAVDRLYSVPNDMMLVVKVLHMDDEEFRLYKETMLAEEEEYDNADVPELVEAQEEAGSSSAAAAGSSSSAATAGPASGADDGSDDEEDGDDEMEEDEEELPEIEDEVGVYLSLGAVMEKVLERYPADVTAETINGMDAVVLDKQAAQYLVLVERQIVAHTLDGILLMQKVLSAEAEQRKATSAGSKRPKGEDDSEPGQPSTKKSKK